MNKLFDICYECPVGHICYERSSGRCFRIEMAASGLGVPSKPKEDDSWIDYIPFGVYVGLKHLVEKNNIEGGN